MTGRVDQRRRCRDEGSALLVCLLCALALSALGSGFIVLANTEAVLAVQQRSGIQALYAAEAGLVHANQVLEGLSSWSDAPSGHVRSGVFDVTMRPTAVWNQVIELAGLTARVQARSDEEGMFGGNRSVWRILASGHESELSGESRSPGDAYVAVWIADDRAESDDDPATDTNGVLAIRAVALTAFGARRGVHGVVRRGAAGVEVLAWREFNGF